MTRRRETDLFYAQRHNGDLGWNTGFQHLSLAEAIGSIRSAYRRGELKRLVRFLPSDAIGIPDALLIIWQGKRVPEWLGELAESNL
ncbi:MULTISPECIES: hypothetical protein [Nocardia]|uniref:Uncharacterized protein n=1 Tax=Nocardia africana TaxID=134964 RepID=A0A378X6E4_9NOCA|nr:hypothetical protein [Nocardia africana]MCC3317927.1 hypothetical protein [Nocardia africana]SUA48702.1 Uncharacterised protein [Nocardia africana]